MQYTILDGEGKPVAGDSVVDDMMKAEADRVGGKIVDEDGKTVYPEEA